ncbi:hypothetical protein [Rhodovulum sp. MB263]|uniref:hypothetical protein n=1 Tax=Rhodovulum sp. (strain MB263) TaxID=308754 RepID=UPI0009B79BB6|nr:hypothetical protein [Rhodovulum sp. MB263]ARC89481.1 hypothetical protein B5V46_13145 [Rhodovulum sp. MB263]
MTVANAGDFSAWGFAAARKALNIEGRPPGASPSGPAHSARDIPGQPEKDKPAGLSYADVATAGLTDLIDRDARPKAEGQDEGSLTLSDPGGRRDGAGTSNATENLVKSMMEIAAGTAEPWQQAASPSDPSGTGGALSQDRATSQIADYPDPDSRAVSGSHDGPATLRPDDQASAQMPTGSATGQLQGEFRTDSSFDPSDFKDQLALQTGIATFQNAQALFSGAAA